MSDAVRTLVFFFFFFVAVLAVDSRENVVSSQVTYTSDQQTLDSFLGLLVGSPFNNRILHQVERHCLSNSTRRRKLSFV